MRRKALSLLVALTLCLGLAIPAAAATQEAAAAADRLHGLGLFAGVGDNEDGTPNYDLDRTPSRVEAITLLVNLLGKGAQAQAGTWNTPFTDVPDWAMPFVGYAYENGLTSGTSATTFGSADQVSAAQYLTFVLRALGYSADGDFAWDASWELTDQLGITGGQYSADSAFTRGDAVLVSAAALDVELKDGSMTLLEAIEAAQAQPQEEPAEEPEEEPAEEPGEEPVLYTFSYTGSAWDEEHYPQPNDVEDGTHKVTMDVLSEYEAVITVETPYAQNENLWYEARFTQSWMEKAIVNGGMEVDVPHSNLVLFTFFSYMEGEEFAVFTLFDGSSWQQVEAEYSQQSRTADSVSCRVKLSENGPVAFEMLKEFVFTGNTACNYGG